MKKTCPSTGDRLLLLLCWCSAITVAGGFMWILLDVIIHGAPSLSLSFILEKPADAGRAGGLFPVLVSTGLLLLVCMAVVFPLGIPTAAFLAEWTATPSSRGRAIRRSLDVLAGVPSIVFGLFGNVFFCVILGLGFSILSGGLTLACMVLPLFIRSVEEGIRSIPRPIHLGAEALGLSKISTFLSLILPQAWPSVVVGFILGAGRALAETAALIFTAGYVDRLPSSLMDSGRALSVHIYDLAMNVPGGNPNAYGASMILIAILLMVNGSALALSHFLLKKDVLHP